MDPHANMTPQPSANTNSSNSEPIAVATNESLPRYESSQHQSQSSASLNNKKIINLKFLNGTSYLLTMLIGIGHVLWKVHEEGIWGDDYLWMKYQTLLTPSNYVNYIWYPIFILQGCFIHASCIHKTYQQSPLVGYNAPPKQSIAVYYPAICATTLMMIYSYDYEYIALALAASILCAGVLIQVLCIQSSVLNDMEGGGDDTSTVTTTTTTTDNQQQSSSSSAIMSNIKERTIQYVAFRLPFELYTGYIIALVALYFNTFLDTAFSNNAADSMGMVFVVVANVSLVALLGVGYILLWKKIPYVMSTSGGGTSDGSSGSKRQFYGVGISLVWYLLGVAIELHDPTQPIYNAYTDGAILTTQIVAGVCTTLLMTMLGVRVTKTMIKYNVFNISGLLLRVGGGGGNGGADTSVFSEESEISTGYVHA